MIDIKINVQNKDNTITTFDAPTDMGLSLMEFLKGNDYDILATCGGMALCSTCHVYVLSDTDLPAMGEDEENMLDQAFFVKDNSRLGCQLPLRPAMEGLKVQLAPEGN